MKPIRFGSYLFIAILFCQFQLAICYSFESEILKEGAELGKWTMDYDQGLELAQKKGLPVFLDFTGSDWCGWCIYMKKNVFNKPEWHQFANKNLSLITIDFPQNPETVPTRFKKRNQQLQMKYGVKGYPTYIILDSDGQSILGRLGASQGQKAKGFVKEITSILRFSGTLHQEYFKILGAEKAEEYKSLVKQFKSTNQKLEGWLNSKPAQNEKNLEVFKKLNNDLTILTVKIDNLEAEKYSKGLNPDSAKQYLQVNKEVNDARIHLNDWLQSGPADIAKNREKHARLVERIKLLESDKNKF